MENNLPVENINNDDGNSELLQSKTIIEHLEDLRKTVFFCLCVIVVFLIVILAGFTGELITFFTLPVKNEGIDIITTGVSEGFSVYIKLGLIAAVALSSPIIFVAIWLFIRSALYKSERRVLAPLLLAAFILFIGGIVFAYFVVFRYALLFLVSFSEDYANPMLSLNEYTSFLFSFLLPFGVVFELPIFIIVLTRLGIVNTKMLTTARKYVILIIFTAAAILTPPDVFSQVLLAIPMMVLYEVGVLASRFVKPRIKLTPDEI